MTISEHVLCFASQRGDSASLDTIAKKNKNTSLSIEAGWGVVAPRMHRCTHMNSPIERGTKVWTNDIPPDFRLLSKDYSPFTRINKNN
jgi:hypothetical protein